MINQLEARQIFFPPLILKNFFFSSLLFSLIHHVSDGAQELLAGVRALFSFLLIGFRLCLDAPFVSSQPSTLKEEGPARALVIIQ